MHWARDARRIIRQLLTESFVLSRRGGSTRIVHRVLPLRGYVAHQGSIALPLVSSIRVDGTALAWTLLITLCSAILFGLVPAFKTSRTNLQDTLKDSGQGMSQGRKHERLRAALVVSEVALACLLLVGAGLLLRSFLQVMDVDLGFQPSHAAALQIEFDDKGIPERRGAILQEMLARVGASAGCRIGWNRRHASLWIAIESWSLQGEGQKLPARENLQGTLVSIILAGVSGCDRNAPARWPRFHLARSV